MQTREEIEQEIETCKESMQEQRNALWWHRLSAVIFWIGVVLSFVEFAILTPLNVPIYQSTLSVVGGISGLIAVISGITWVVSFDADTSDASIERVLKKITVTDRYKELRKARRTLSVLQRKLVVYDEQAFKKLHPRERHLQELEILIASYRKEAKRYRRWAIFLQVIVIFLSAGVASISGGWIDRYFSLSWMTPVAVPAASLTISILTSFTLFFKYKEKGANLQQTADALDLERKAYLLGIRHYKGKSPEDALVLLAEETELLREKQQQRQQQLEQSSHEEHKVQSQLS